MSISDKEYHELPELCCPECGKKMKTRLKKVVKHTITGTISTKMAEYFCPSLWCRLVHYNFMTIYRHYQGILLENGNWKIQSEIYGY